MEHAVHRHFPGYALAHGIPRLQRREARAGARAAADELSAHTVANRPRRGAPRFRIETLVVEGRGEMHGRVIGEPRLRVEGHRVPAVRADWRRRHRRDAALVTRAFHFHGAARLLVAP